MNRKERVHIFVTEIWNWFAVHKRDLPWRDLAIPDDTERAYRILVSEVMLQQTQVSRVIVIYKRFLEAFPTLSALAKASNRDVLIAWRGMGYNSRALRLRDAAKTIMEDFSGIFPKTMEELQSIKGIGHYTAAAIRNFAFGIPTPCIDTNIRRVLHRTFVGAEDGDGAWRKKDDYLLKLAEEVLNEAVQWRMDNGKWIMMKATMEWHHALMDFGSIVQTKRNPKWDICPLTKRGICRAAKQWNKEKKVRHAEQAPRRPSTPPRAALGSAQDDVSGAVSKHVVREPGRFVGTVYIPNRIFRGKIVEELRDAKNGLLFAELGGRVCLDWKPAEHQKWFKGLLKKLEYDALIERKRNLYGLKW
ncbi:A/G-specific adenine glycosylase [Candidatus Peregrinibacteria bacterium]|nr:A/G-specific adenine glycosylase [Candidatus Peregrinibacteria bacterium]